MPTKALLSCCLVIGLGSTIRTRTRVSRSDNRLLIPNCNHRSIALTIRLYGWHVTIKYLIYLGEKNYNHSSTKCNFQIQKQIRSERNKLSLRTKAVFSDLGFGLRVRVISGMIYFWCVHQCNRTGVVGIFTCSNVFIVRFSCCHRFGVV